MELLAKDVLKDLLLLPKDMTSIFHGLLNFGSSFTVQSGREKLSSFCLLKSKVAILQDLFERV